MLALRPVGTARKGPGNPADMWTFRPRDGEAGFEALGVTQEADKQQVVASKFLIYPLSHDSRCTG